MASRGASCLSERQHRLKFRPARKGHLAAHILRTSLRNSAVLSRYFKARDKRSTIVIARVTRKAKRHLSLSLCAKYDVFRILAFLSLYNLALDHAFLLLNHFL